MAARQVGVWGIDLGQCALKAIRLEMKDGEVVATAFEYIEHPKILSQPDADPDELTREALNQFLERNKIKGDLVAISVPGQSGLARFVKLPPVDEKKIADIVKFEAKQQIPFPLEEVVWDFQRLNKGDIVDGLALETEIGLFAMKRDMVLRAIQQFKSVNVEVHLVQMAPLALNNFVSYDLLGKTIENMAEDDDSSECIVCLEIGTDASNLVITDGSRIIWQRPIPIGGNHFTRALTKEMKLTFAKAEHLKRNASKSPDLKKILSSLKQVLNDFVGEVQRSLGYFTNTHRTAQIKYMIGLGNAFRLPGLQKFLQEKLQLEVRKLQKLEQATGETVTTAPTFAENIMSFGVAYGLAVQGLHVARLQTNLLPYEVRLERMIRGKKPWLVTAAASLLFGLFLLAFGRGVEKNAIANPEIAPQAKQLETVAKKVVQLNNDLLAEQDKLNKLVDVLGRIGAGVDQRMNWPLLHQYINMCTPQPNGDRLTPMAKRGFPAKKIYWDANPDAKKAFTELEKMKFEKNLDNTSAEAKKRERFIKEHLIQINVAGVNAMWCEDLGAYFEKLKKDNPRLLGMVEEEQEEIKSYVAERTDETTKEKAKQHPILKDGKEAWIVEIRGYTYHQKTDQFVMDTIVENLRFPDGIKAMADKDVKMSTLIKDRVRYLTIFNIKQDKNPIPGQFNFIRQSNLRALVKGDEGQPGPNIIGRPPIQAPEDAAKGGAQKPSRDLWRPIGETAISIFGEGAVGGRPPVPPPPPLSNPADPKALPEVPRTEFVLLLVWREPIAGAPSAVAAADKK